jgi:hypothetical protein
MVWQARKYVGDVSVHFKSELNILQLQGVLTDKNPKYGGQHACSRTYRYELFFQSYGVGDLLLKFE